MDTLGNPEVVITNFLRKQRELEKGIDSRSIRPALIVLGGGTAGVKTAGYLRALAEHAPAAPNVCAGVSVGAINLYNFLAGDADIAPFMYPKLVEAGLASGGEKPWEDFINLVIRVHRHRNKQKNVYNHRSHFRVYATEFGSGKGVGIDAKQTKPDILEAVHASCMLYGMCSGTVHLDGVEHVDGGYGIPFPVRRIIRRYRPTDILILSNRVLPHQMGWFRWYWFPVSSWIYLLLNDVPFTLRNLMANSDRVLAHEIRLLAGDDRRWWSFFKKKVFGIEPKPSYLKRISWGIIAPKPNEDLSFDSTDMERLTKDPIQTYDSMKDLIAKCERELELEEKRNS